MTFNDFGFAEPVVEGFTSMGYKLPTPVQQQCIPLIMEGNDLIACAQTGTGKTAAFLLPLLNRMVLEPTTKSSALIIVPTRELAIQIDEAIQALAYFSNISSMPIFGGTGGSSFEQEKKALSEGANIIIATPGRLIAHLNMGYVQFGDIQTLILDEADRMLDMGFFEDIMKIVKQLPAKRQTLLFSATMPPKIRELAHQILKEPKQINISISKPAEKIIQKVSHVYNPQKIPLLQHVLKNVNHQSIIVFCSSKDSVKQLTKTLKSQQLHVASIHSDLDQNERNDVLRQFKNRSLRILVATDVLSRGIDIDSIGMVINFDVPHDAEDYVHRIGRTARAESDGEALTLVNEADQIKLSRIEKLIGYSIPTLALPDELGKGPEYRPQSNSANKNKRKPMGKRPARNTNNTKQPGKV
jgi:ATP-dependent RNA helicase RhlE